MDLLYYKFLFITLSYIQISNGEVQVLKSNFDLSLNLAFLEVTT